MPQTLQLPTLISEAKTSKPYSRRLSNGLPCRDSASLAGVSGMPASGRTRSPWEGCAVAGGSSDLALYPVGKARKQNSPCKCARCKKCSISYHRQRFKGSHTGAWTGLLRKPAGKWCKDRDPTISKAEASCGRPNVNRELPHRAITLSSVGDISTRILPSAPQSISQSWPAASPSP